VQKGRRIVTAWEAVSEAYTVIRLCASPARSAAAAVRVLEWATESGVDLALTSQKDHLRAAAILRGHRALRLSYVDALLLALAEALEVEEIMTTDGRHFAAVKLRGRPTVTLV
jgi:predicted nucleic acid-binding protein